MHFYTHLYFYGNQEVKKQSNQCGNCIKPQVFNYQNDQIIKIFFFFAPKYKVILKIQLILKKYFTLLIDKSYVFFS